MLYILSKRGGTMALQESGEMYLESIYVLLQKNGQVRSVDVAEYMGYSKPSISRAMGLLKAGDFITIDGDGIIALTPAGVEVARKIYERHTLLTNLLVRLGVNQAVASEDACKLEHAISDESFAAIKKFVTDLEKTPTK